MIVVDASVVIEVLLRTPAADAIAERLFDPTLLEADATVGLPSVPADVAAPVELPAHPPPATPAPRDSWKTQLRGVRAAFDPTLPPAAPAACSDGVL